MTKPQGGGGTPVTTYEAIVLAMLGYEPMAANYGDDDDWCGLTLDDVDSCIDRKTIDTGTMRYEQPVAFNLVSFRDWGPFEVWDDRGRGIVSTMRRMANENQPTYEARDAARGATLVTACPSCQHLPHVGRCPGYANCGCDTGVSD